LNVLTPAQEHSAPAPAPARSAIPNPALVGFEKIKSGATPVKVIFSV